MRREGDELEAGHVAYQVAADFRDVAAHDAGLHDDGVVAEMDAEVLRTPQEQREPALHQHSRLAEVVNDNGDEHAGLAGEPAQDVYAH